MFNFFNVTLQFRNNIYGGLPKSKKLVEDYVAAKFASDDISKVATDLDLDNETERVTTGFKADETGIYIGDYAIKAGLKQWASLMKLTTNKRGTKNTVSEATFVKGVLDGKLTNEKVYFQPLRTAPDGIEDFAGHVLTLRGKRSILKSAEFVSHAQIHFQIWALAVRMQSGKELTSDDIHDMLTFGGEVGLGSCRSFERGKFDVIEFVVAERGFRSVSL